MSAKLRIAVWYNLPFGGAKRALYNHLRGLHASGHELEIWSPPLPPDDFLPMAQLGKVHTVPLDFREHAPGSSPRALLNYAKRVGRLLPAMHEHSKTCAQQIEAGGFDLLFANTCELLHTPMIGQHVSKIPKLLYLQDPFRALYEAMPRLRLAAPPPGADLKARVKDRVDLSSGRKQAAEELASAESYGQILVNSYFSREAILRAFALDSRVCYLGIDTEEFRPLGLPRERFVIGVGTMGPAKNARLVVEAIGRMPTPRPPLVWTCNMFDPVYFAEVEARAKALGVELRLMKMTPDDEVVRLLNTASAMAYAPRLEPFGLVPIEANACGLPVVAVAEGGVRETMVDGETGLLVDNDPDAMGAALGRLLDDAPFRERLSAQAIARTQSRWTLKAADDRLSLEIERFLNLKSST